MYAIRKAAKWTVFSRDKLPSVSAFTADVRVAIGSRLLLGGPVNKRSAATDFGTINQSLNALVRK